MDDSSGRRQSSMLFWGGPVNNRRLVIIDHWRRKDWCTSQITCFRSRLIRAPIAALIGHAGKKESTDFAWEGNGLPRIRFPESRARQREMTAWDLKVFGMACRSSRDCDCTFELVRYSSTSHQLAQGEPTQVGVSPSFMSSLLYND